MKTDLQNLQCEVLTLKTEVARLNELLSGQSDRRAIYSIQVSDNLASGEPSHWRWAGSLNQVVKDVKEYVGEPDSDGRFSYLAENKIVWRANKKHAGRIQIITFHAVKGNVTNKK
jgi:hypothetical protein